MMVKNPLQKLIIGTANFGLDYGIVSGKGKVSSTEVYNILNIAINHGIKTFDTATGYGDAETILGKAFKSMPTTDFQVITKLLPSNERYNEADVQNSIIENVELSCSRLGVTKLEALLIHRASNVFSECASYVWRALIGVKEVGLAGKIGVSVYTKDEIDRSLTHGYPDIIQLPFNIADQRLQEAGKLEKLKKQGVEIHARSVFLQGVLLEDQEDLHPFFKKEAIALGNLTKLATDLGISRLEVCLGFVMQSPFIDRLVLGVQSGRQLEEIIESCRKIGDIQIDGAACQWRDTKLLNPSNWLELQQNF